MAKSSGVIPKGRGGWLKLAFSGAVIFWAGKMLREQAAKDKAAGKPDSIVVKVATFLGQA